MLVLRVSDTSLGSLPRASDLRREDVANRMVEDQYARFSAMILAGSAGSAGSAGAFFFLEG